MVNGQWIGWGFRPKPLVSDGLVMVSTASGIASGVATSVSTGIAALVATTIILVVFNCTWVGTGHALNLLAIAVVAGNLDSGAG